MRLILDSTSQILQMQVRDEDGPIFPARVWEGWTGANVPVVALIVRVFPPIPPDDPRNVEFIRDLVQADAPRSPTVRIPKRLIL